MTNALLHSDSVGMDVIDLQGNIDFAQRPSRSRDMVREIEAMQRLARVFAASSQGILQELASIVIELCGADSAGISMEETTPAGEKQFRWIAIAGVNASFLNAALPARLAPCRICLDRNRPQLIRVSKTYLDATGLDAQPLTDGILIPWQVNGTRGTIWAVAHTSHRLFDMEDFRVLQELSDFAAMAVRGQALRDKLTRQAAATAAAAMANDLAHCINNPLQSLMNTVFLASQGGTDAGIFARQATDDLLKLSALVSDLLQRPAKPVHREYIPCPAIPSAAVHSSNQP